MNKIKSLIAGVFLSLIMVNTVSAKECHTVYGGGEVCEYCDISIDKEVWNPEEDEYWDNIDSSDYSFEAGEEVKFKIVIRNTSEIDIESVKVQDYLPSYVDFVSTSTDDDHDYDRDDDEIIYYIGTLSEDESETIYLTVRVKDENNIPVGITTLTNKAKGYSDDECSDTDYANFAIDREGKGTVLGTTSPETGSNSLILAIELLGFLGMAGAYKMVAKRK